MGYLQIKNPDKALEYMRKSLQEFHNEQKIGQIPEDILGAILLGWINRLKNENIKTFISYPEILKDQSYWQDNWFEEYAEAFYGYTIECMESTAGHINKLTTDSYAEISLEEGISCIFRLVSDGVLVKEKRINLGSHLI